MWATGLDMRPLGVNIRPCKRWARCLIYPQKRTIKVAAAANDPEQTLPSSSTILVPPLLPLKSGVDMRRRKLLWLLLTALVISMQLAGTSHARSLYWSPYRSWWGNQTFRPKHQHGHKIPDSTNQAQSQDASKGASKDAAKGPLLIIISVADQRISLYDNGTLLARSSVSTGVKDHPTPLGVFSVIGKSRWHRSNIYSGAPMPYIT